MLIQDCASATEYYCVISAFLCVFLIANLHLKVVSFTFLDDELPFIQDSK